MCTGTKEVNTFFSGRQECLLHFLVAFKISHLSFTAMQVVHEDSAFLWAFHHLGTPFAQRWEVPDREQGGKITHSGSYKKIEA